MGRYLRNAKAGATYHVCFKVQGDEFWLMHHEDVLVIESYAVRYKRVHGVKVLNFSVMSNHVHIMIENAEDDEWAMSYFLRDVKRESAKYFNIAYGTKGNFWVGGFGAREIRDARQKYCNDGYILNNAVQARMCGEASEYAHAAFPLLMTQEEIRIFKGHNRFMAPEEAEAVIAASKRVGYAGRLPEEARVERGLGWDLRDKRLMPLLHQGRRDYKRRGPKPYWHPEDDRRTVDKIDRFMALAMLDESSHFGPTDPIELKRYCESKAQLTEESWERIDGMRIIFESCSKKACQKYQDDFMDSLPPNAQLPESVIPTGRGTWALVAIRGRPRWRE